MNLSPLESWLLVVWAGVSGAIAMVALAHWLSKKGQR